MQQKCLFRMYFRQFCTAVKQKPKIISNENVLNNIENGKYKPRQHPGIIKLKSIKLPEKFINAARNILEDQPVKAIASDTHKLHLQLKGRLVPIEQTDLEQLRNDTYRKIFTKESKKVDADIQETNEFKQKVKDKTVNILKKSVYNWAPVNFNLHNSLVYLLGRTPAEYAVLSKIFYEISLRDKEFVPKSLFDFGSGVGSATWAANEYWPNKIIEYFNVDSSSTMNDLAEMLLKDGRGNKESSLKGVFYRQFLPAQNISYDLVVSAFTLFELPSFKSRMESILNLWNKTSKYLVVVEQGTNAGFNLINQVREFILQKSEGKVHVFSPCPHDLNCPRFLEDNTPCNFEISYWTMPIGAKEQLRSELYSYVVLKKDVRNGEESMWPRIVREKLVRSKHSICRLCTQEGKLQEVIFTASKHGKNTYQCARAAKWGDRLPITIENNNATDQC